MKFKGISFFENLFVLFVLSLFLTIGSDRTQLLTTRMIFGGIILCLGFFILRSSRTNLFTIKPRRISVWIFAILLLFEILRPLVTACVVWITHSVQDAELLKIYNVAPLKWGFYFGFFLLGYLLFKSRARVGLFANCMVWSGFFLAANAVPPLLQNGVIGYPLGRIGVFFHPIFYVHPWVYKYLFGTFAHLNYAGDLTAFGFFTSLGIVFYKFLIAQEQWVNQSSQKMNGRAWAFLALYLTAACVMAAAVLLFFSRGTMIFFAAALSLFLFGIVIKFRQRGQWKFVLIIFVALFGFLCWAGNFQEAIKELQTLQVESETKDSSLAHNKEAGTRAIRIYQQYPLWGVGTDGYVRFSKKYASPDTEKLPLANFAAMCHYLQLLAEEGIGAFIYYLFLIVYLFEVFRGILFAESRFKFVMGLSLLSAIVMIMGHASINHLMQRFPIALLIYLTMGVSLSIFRDDFQHD